MNQRYEAPAADNKYYLRPEYGGYNKCININKGSVLPNCCGMAFGRWLESANETSCRLSTGDAENWWDYPDGYERGQTPKQGAIMCWRKGAAHDGSDGHGHVEFVEQVNADGSVVTTGSNYGGTRWYRHTRQKPYAIAGQVFQGFIYNPGTEVKPIDLKDGYQKVEVSGYTAHLYKQNSEKLVLIADECGRKSDIKDFKIPGKKVKAAMNCSFFDMSGTQEYFGRVQGFRNHTGAIVDDRPPAPAETGGTGDKAFMDYVIKPDNSVEFGDLFSWDLQNSAGDLVGFSPAGIEIHNGQAVNKYSPGAGYSKITTPHHTSALLKSHDGKWVFCVIPANIATIPTLQTWALNNGFLEMCVLDGGGSAQLAVNGGAVVYTGRYIPVVLALVEDEDAPEPVQPETPADPDEPTVEPDTPAEPETPEEPAAGIDWAQKLSSRKLWLAIVPMIVGLLVKLGLPETETNTVTSALLIVLPALAYILVEGLVDAARARGKNTEMLEAIAQALLKGLDDDDEN